MLWQEVSKPCYTQNLTIYNCGSDDRRVVTDDEQFFNLMNYLENNFDCTGLCTPSPIRYFYNHNLC